MIYEQLIGLDINRRNTYVYAKQADNKGRVLRVKLMDGNKIITIPSGATVTLRAEKPDGTYVVNNGSRNSDGTASIALTDQVLAVEGLVNADINVVVNGESVSSATFGIKVGKMPSGSAVTSSNEFLTLEKLIEEATAVTQNVVSTSAQTLTEAQKAQARANIGITEYDDTSVQGEIRQLKNDIVNVEEDAYSYSLISSVATASGWKLNDNDGFSSIDSAYKMVKFEVEERNIYKISGSKKFQFQSSPSVPSSGTSNRVGITYQSDGYAYAPVGSTYLIVSALSESDVSVSVGESMQTSVVNVKNDLAELDKNDYIKIYNISMPSNRAVRFVPIVRFDDILTNVKIQFDYESSSNMKFATWRVVVYGGTNYTGGVGTLLHTFSGSSFQQHFELESNISDSNKYDYIQIFTEFIYDTDTYSDDIVLNNYIVTLNNSDSKIVGCNTWQYSSHTSTYKFKSNLYPAYAKKEELLLVTKKNPQLIVSIIDDDSNYCAPEIWGEILQNNDDVKIGFACMTGYMNGTYTNDTTFKQMTLSQLKDFYKNGHEVYSHGYGCYSVRGLNEKDLESECRKSKDWLYDNGFMRGSETIVYSGGANDDANQQNIVRGYYKYGVNAWGTGINSDIIYGNPLYISRVIGDTLNLAQLKQTVDDYVSSGGILVFGFHSYELNKDADNNVTKIRDLITYIKGKNAKIVPIERAIRSIYGVLAD